MDDNVQKSCWGFATWTVIILGVALAVALVSLGDFGAMTVAAS